MIGFQQMLGNALMGRRKFGITDTRASCAWTMHSHYSNFSSGSFFFCIGYTSGSPLADPERGGVVAFDGLGMAFCLCL